VEFETPYTATGSDIYVGYSFNVDNLVTTNKYPVQLTSEGLGTEGGLYLHTSRTYLSWKDRSAVGCSRMQVLLSGVKADAASVADFGTIYGKTGEAIGVDMKVFNHGTAGISSLDYAYELNGATGTAHVDLATPVTNIYDAYATQAIELPAIASKGVYDLKLTVTRVNGMDNADANPVGVGTLKVYDVVPKHRAVMEEYTGLWCGYCPRGFVGLEVMNKLYPDDFIGISYHYNDSMMVTQNYPSPVDGFPTSYLDRVYSVDPYGGFDLTGESFGIDDAWLKACETFSPAVVDVAARLSGDNSKVSVTSSVTFPLPESSLDYKVEMVLLADDLNKDLWSQSNYYSGMGKGVYEASEFDKFTDGDSYVSGLHFDDVVVATTRLTGDDVALPSSAEADVPYTASAEFTLADIVNSYGKSIIQDLTKLRVVAIVVDNATGAIVNANKCNVQAGAAGIKVVNAEAVTRDARIYDLSGRRIKSMSRGINIVRTASGNTIKVVRR